jgi:hypothetical protein
MLLRNAATCYSFAAIFMILLLCFVSFYMEHETGLFIADYGQ